MYSCLPLKNQRGGILMPVLVVVVTFGVAASAALTRVRETQKINVALGITQGAERARSEVLGLVLDPRSWEKTQLANSAKFSAFNPSEPPLLQLVQSNGDVYYDSENTHAGFDPNGLPCDTYTELDAGAGSDFDACPFRYEIRLVDHVLVNGSWVDTIRFDLKYSGSQATFNSRKNRYSLQLTRNFGGSSAESACISIGGAFGANSGACTTQITQTVTCAGSDFMRGPRDSGSVARCNVAVRPAVTCAAPKVVKGFDNQGNATCADPI